MSKIKKPVIWEGDNDMMIPYQGVAMSGEEIELDEDLADEISAGNRGRGLTDEEQATSQGWQRYLERKGQAPTPPVEGGGE